MTCERADDACPGCDASVDVAPDAEIGCWSAWLGGMPALSSPRLIAELSTANSDGNPSFAEDDRALYFGRGGEVLYARRPTLTGVFSPPMPVAALLSPLDDSRVTVAANERIAVLASRREGGSGGSDLWYTTRSNVNDTFAAPTQTLVASLVDADSQFDPELTPDGLRLYYSSALVAGGQRIMVADRAATVMPFGVPSEVALSGASTLAADPTLSPDERVIVFASGISVSETDLYFAVRGSRSDPFGTAVPLTAINAGDQDADPDLAADGCSLAFSSTRAEGVGARDLWIVDVIR